MGVQLTYAHDKPPPGEEAEEIQVAMAEAAGSNANGGNYDEDELDPVQASSAKIIRQESEQELADNGAEQGAKVDDKAPVASVGKVNKLDGCENNIGGKKIVAG